MTKSTYITITTALFMIFALSIFLALKMLSIPSMVLSVLTAFLCIIAIFAVLIIYIYYEKEEDEGKSLPIAIKQLLNNKSFKLPVNKISISNIDQKRKNLIGQPPTA